jgi:TnpA family transposase
MSPYSAGSFLAACGTYEATYILDALLQNLSDLRPRRVHADTQIHEHYQVFMQLALAIESGMLAPSTVLARINSYSTRNRLALALQELGKAVRTTYLLEWMMDEEMRRAVHKCTTKIERHHQFAKHLAFGGHGRVRANDPADQEKAVVYNEFVANAVVLQDVADQTRALHALKADGATIRGADLAFLSRIPRASSSVSGTIRPTSPRSPCPPWRRRSRTRDVVAGFRTNVRRRQQKLAQSNR